MESVGALIVRARRSAGLTQVQLSEKIATSQPALARYESGMAMPTLANLERIMIACGYRLDMRIKKLSEDEAAPTSSIGGQLGPLARMLRIRRRLLMRSASDYGIGVIRVYGDAVRGDKVEVVQLLVDPERAEDSDLAAFQKDARRLLGMSVEVTTLAKLKPSQREKVDAEAVPL